MSNEAYDERAHKQQEVIRAAVGKADEILIEASAGDSKMLDGMTVELLLHLVLQIRRPGRQVRNKYKDVIVAAMTAIIDEIDKNYPQKSQKAVASYVYYRVVKKFVEKVGTPFERDLALWEMNNPPIS